MPVDYDAIREDNISRYGWDTALLDLLGELYSHRTHFLFELIQNAEDAGASELTFQLFGDRLEVHHDGRPFTEGDVIGICGVKKSTKAGDLTKIGKFGIGFKSVYAYTATPRVHSGGEHFRIDKYVRPFATEPVILGAGQTRFVFPFDHPGVAAEEAVGEISAALNELELETLLFLRNIERVRVGGLRTADAVLERAAAERGPSSRDVMLTESSGDSRNDERWFVWHRELEALDRPEHRVEIAFRVTSEDGSPRLQGLETSPLVVFFPTEKETFLGFRIQGPYRTTPARDNVPEHDAWNQSLVGQTADLVSVVLTEARDEGLLTTEVLQAMPLDGARFPEGSMFRPLFDATRQAVAHERLVPVAGGGYGRAAELKLARGAGLRDLMSGEQLMRLYGEESPPAFAHESITPDRAAKLYRYLREVIGVEEVTPEAIMARVTGEFLAAEPDGWIARFYGFLHANPALWRLPRFAGDQPGLARLKPVVRLEDGTHIQPFNTRGLPAAYLPGPSETEFPTVRRAVAEYAEARQFLEALKFTEPDVVAEVLDKVLPRYQQLDAKDLDATQHVADLERIARALKEAPSERRKRLREHLRATAFLVGVNAGSGELRLRTPPSLYERTPGLDVYFAGNENIWFLNDGYEAMLADLRDLGVDSAPWVEARAQGYLGYVVTVDAWGHHERGVDGFDPSAKADGLQFALQHPNDARSEYVWNFVLAPHRHLLAGIVEKSGRQDFSDARREEHRSPIGIAATTAAWLPGTDGTLHRPAELLLEDLPASYKRDEVLAKALGMQQPVVEEASKQLRIPADLLRRLSADPDLVARIQRELAAALTGEGSADAADAADDDAAAEDPGPDGFSYATALSGAFDRAGRSAEQPGDGTPGGDVASPGIRRERLREEIEEDKRSEPPPQERFQRVPRRVWEAKDSAVRHFLREQYEGRCQLCSETFFKRDGTPYFEGLSLVGRVRGRWLDRPGNVICLCASCCAKFQHGPVEAPDIVEQIASWATKREGGSEALLALRLCGEAVQLRFTEKHLLDLQEIVLLDLGEPPPTAAESP